MTFPLLGNLNKCYCCQTILMCTTGFNLYLYLVNVEWICVNKFVLNNWNPILLPTFTSAAASYLAIVLADRDVHWSVQHDGLSAQTRV